MPVVTPSPGDLVRQSTVTGYTWYRTAENPETWALSDEDFKPIACVVLAGYHYRTFTAGSGLVLQGDDFSSVMSLLSYPCRSLEGAIKYAESRALEVIAREVENTMVRSRFP